MSETITEILHVVLASDWIVSFLTLLVSAKFLLMSQCICICKHMTQSNISCVSVHMVIVSLYVHCLIKSVLVSTNP